MSLGWCPCPDPDLSRPEPSLALLVLQAQLPCSTLVTLHIIYYYITMEPGWGGILSNTTITNQHGIDRSVTPIYDF